jgi:hypothetical protein
MGKKRRERREVAGPVRAVVEAELGRADDGREYREMLDRSSSSIERTWAVEASKASYRDDVQRDGVLIVAPHWKINAQAKVAGADPTINALTVVVFNDHFYGYPAALPALIDVEDAKALVNALSEAIAYAEGRTR